MVFLSIEEAEEFWVYFWRLPTERMRLTENVKWHLLFATSYDVLGL
jgi:hypothetical protein